MKISNKIHRSTSIAAAVVMIITLIIGIISQAVSLSSNGMYYDTTYIITSVVKLGINSVAALMLIVILFRGKKDSAAGVLIILSALPIILVGAVGNISGMAAYISMKDALPENMFGCMMTANVIRVFSHLLNVVFRVFLAVECFKPGSISGGKMKPFLIIMPIVYFVMVPAATMIQSLYMAADMGFGELLLVTLIPAAISAIMYIENVIVGIAFSIPVYEKITYGYAYPNQTGYSY